jgi:hypothetical protein
MCREKAHDAAHVAAERVAHAQSGAASGDELADGTYVTR